MEFKPFGKEYIFPKDTLVENFPDYMIHPIKTWFDKVLSTETNDGHFYVDGSYATRVIKDGFKSFLNTGFRESFPSGWDNFLKFTFENKDRTCNVIAVCLQNYADRTDADVLEYVLSQGGSAYEVTVTNKQAPPALKGNYDLAMRVPVVVKEQAGEALSNNEVLEEAWGYCYHRSPDYEKVVSRCSDFLEGLLGAKYFPTDPKPQLKKFIHSFEASPEKLTYKGDSIVKPKSMLTSLLKEVSNIRGQHIQGQGRKPTKDESEFVLHTTILIWNLHNGVTS